MRGKMTWHTARAARAKSARENDARVTAKVPPKTISNAGPLTKEDGERLEELVAVVDRGMMSFVAVGNALSEINARHLYRITADDSFAECCRDRSCSSRQRAWQLMNSAGVAKILDQENPSEL